MSKKTEKLQLIINEAFDKNTYSNETIVKDTIIEIFECLNNGTLRVCEKINNKWLVHEWIKKAILLSFKLLPNQLISGAPYNSHWYDKVNNKFAGWDSETFAKNQIRAVPLSYVRIASYIGKNVILMPSFVNIGAFIDDGTMIDSWATIGSCAQIGKNCHISGGTGIGGVLEPLQASPVIIEDNCFIGARSEIAEGVIIEQGSVISMGVFISQSTKIINRQTGEICYGHIPPFSVVVAGNTSSGSNGLSLYCAVIVKTVDEKTRSKTSINELLRT